MKENCILCKSENLKTLQKIKTSDINSLYLKDLGIDILEEYTYDDIIDYKKCLRCNLHFFSPQYTGSPQFYESLLKPDDFYYKNNRYEFHAAKKFIKKKDKVLEIGAGVGHFSDIINVDDYIGLEYNDKAIQEAQKKGIKLIKKSIEEVAKISENTYDVVCSFQVLEHVDNPNSYIESSLKVLKKGGLIIFGVPSAESFLTNNINHTLNFPPHHITRWYNKTFKYFEKIFNLELVSIENEPVSNRLRKRYIVDKFTTIFYRFFSFKKIIISNSNRYIFFRKVIKKIITIFNINFSTKNEKGEAVIVILKKK